ncbi:MAG: hypothetical protein ATN35_03120 [Epulopiscium sp. Nele67-Bin004]|nr:MAG: hypothetical protein ATN35_03120 [Epulopiscium sp. Nele67-Bin004]
MLVKNIMIPESKLTTVKMTDTVQDALELIDSKNLLSLPVVEDKKFVGVISKKYIFEEFYNNAEPKETFGKRPISDFMKTAMEYVYKDEIVEVAVKMLKDYNIQFLPVLNSKQEFAGIVTHKAVFSTLTNVFGFGHTRMVITTHDIKGRLAKLAELIHKHDGNIISIVEVDIELMDLRQLILRVDVEDVRKLCKKLDESGFRVRRIDENV